LLKHTVEITDNAIQSINGCVFVHFTNLIKEVKDKRRLANRLYLSYITLR